jgi:tRNA-binding EMAP/Myf-like protein
MCTVETGEATRRTVISGLVEYIPMDQMQVWV